jgi:hypothetical protein
VTELFQAGGEILLLVIHKFINSVWNKEELPVKWKKSIIAPIHKKKGDKTDSSNYCGISLLSTSYRILSNILLSSLSLYADEVIGDHQCRFRRNRSATDHIFCICQAVKGNGSILATHDFKKAYDSVMMASIVQYSHRVWSTHKISQAD